MTTHLQLRRRETSGYVLVHGTREVGWLRPGRIGFDGFTNRHAAHTAALYAARLVQEWSELRQRPALDPLPSGTAMEKAVQIDGRTVGRVEVLDPAAVAMGAPGYGFELAVSLRMWRAVMLELAQRIYTTMPGSDRARHEELV